MTELAKRRYRKLVLLEFIISAIVLAVALGFLYTKVAHAQERQNYPIMTTGAAIAVERLNGRENSLEQQVKELAQKVDQEVTWQAATAVEMSRVETTMIERDKNTSDNYRNITIFISAVGLLMLLVTGLRLKNSRDSIDIGALIQAINHASDKNTQVLLDAMHERSTAQDDHFEEATEDLERNRKSSGSRKSAPREL